MSKLLNHTVKLPAGLQIVNFLCFGLSAASSDLRKWMQGLTKYCRYGPKSYGIKQSGTKTLW